MPWPVHPNGLLGAQGDNDAYRVERSLRFNSGDSAYLNRTLSTPTSQSIFTLSLWVKLGLLGTTRQIFGVSTNHSFGFTTGDALNLTFAASSALTTTALFRDPSAWYHIVWTQNGTSHTLYVNGVSVGTATATSNTFNTAVAHQLGAANTASYFNGYLTEINFIDGQALTPSSFGETDAITGRWKAKAYSGTYGTNGFYLKFADNSGTTSTTLGKDSSPNSNNWTPNNFSVTAGVGNDSLVDSPTNYGIHAGVGGEVRGNYATLNPLQVSSGSPVASKGNLRLSGALSGYPQMGCTFGNAINGFKGYFEVTLTGSNDVFVGFNYASAAVTNTDYTTTGCVYVNPSGNLRNGGSTVQSGYLASFSANDVIMIAFDFTGSNKNIWWGRNGTWGTRTGLGVPSTGAFPGITVTEMTSADTRLYLTCGGGSSTPDYNFGQRPFAYTAPTGFKALCTTNLPTPAIKKPSKYMDALAYTGTGASNSISSLGFSPDLVWIKSRGGATSHAIYDTSRGIQAQLSSDTTDAEVTSSTGLTTFGSNGFTIGTSTLVNTSGTQYVAWGWDEAPIAGFDIVSYQGNGSAGRNISHNLGVAPKFIIVKNRVTAGFDFVVYHASMNATPQNGYMTLNGTLGYSVNSTIWNNTAPTSSVFTVGTNTALNKTGENHIAYLWAEVEGFSKIGSYVGNSSADGAFVWCGFRPRYILFKNPSGGTYWQIYDAARNTYNVVNSDLYPSNAAAEQADASLDILSNGFKARSITYINDATINFVAFAESPFKYARAR